ncbi:protein NONRESPONDING TO OXYLIPINS 2, mitochondrial isoform X2 [Lotus japonicus]|uniref:protein NONRESPONDING TO OXYLIPINS 2, mitochondrial isoform X2 n=1 Tax=Lotus japonicus TaxID=34305 RepID=UPI00258D4E6A|nr:protein NONRESPONDING TO OXYLIPINS 2, mitochondrial isoform X2 [Lotus japonicus]
MASMFCNSALRVASRSLTNRSRTFAQKSSIPSLFSSPSSAGISRASRVLSAIGSVQSTMPLHSAIANARLTSNMACDSTCWSMLSQDFAVPR